MFNTNENSPIHQIRNENQLDIDLPIEEPTDLEDLKTSDIIEEQLNHNFSLDVLVNESWTEIFFFPELNSTKLNEKETDWIEIPRTNGSRVSFIYFVSNLVNLSDGQSVMPSNFTTMKLSYSNQSLEREEIGEINDISQPNKDGLNGTISGIVDINETENARFVIWNDWVENTNISYNAIMLIAKKRQYSLTSKFIPTKENTQSDKITWEINFEGHQNCINYDGYVKIEELDNFTVGNVLGYDGNYWTPLNYSRNESCIFINDPFLEYKIELQTPNYLTILFNDNLTGMAPELRLYSTCGISGNLTVRFKLTNGTVLTKSWLVQENETIFYNFIMPFNTTGGVGSLNITLTNNSKSEFGVKIREVFFHKNSFLQGYTDNTSAFSQFFVAVAYIDWDTIGYLYYLNSSSPSLNLTSSQIQDMSVIQNATVTYELEDLQGELEYQFLGGWYGAPNITAYWTVVDLSEYLIPPGMYNLTFTASKIGYDTLVSIVTIEISAKPVEIEIEISDTTFVIEEPFSISINLKDNQTKQPYLALPVVLNLTFINNDTKTVEVETQIYPVIQSFPIIDVMDNKTLPGNYILNIVIDSEYYYGNASSVITVAKRVLDFDLTYKDTVDEDEKFDITWSLDDGNFTGNRMNMTLEVYIDGILYRSVNLTSTNTSSGAVTFELNDGDHIIRYLINSPFYELDRSITIEAEKDSKKEKEPSWLEENLLWVVMVVILIFGSSIFGIYMTISRRKVKAQRELESELVALKTKYAATEKNVSLIETQISQIAGIYWILIIHAEQGVTMVEITDFMFDKVLSKEYQQLAEEGVIRDSALIGGFLTAIRNFSRETSGIESEHQAIFNSQTDYSTIVNDKQIHRRILEGTNYFMAFISARGTTEISDVLGAINSIFNDDYGEAVKSFLGRITVFDPFKVESVAYLHNMIIEMQKKLEDEKLMLEHYQRHLKQVQDKIGIKKNK